ncbi:hypothetical protein Q3Y53_02325 [Synechococcus sp. YX-04-1]|nr:hypothetical protein [Synechococcus sp. YX-04-1]MDO6351368.1 hypothetical protein [Synechococcus sp. YX-04-1]
MDKQKSKKRNKLLFWKNADEVEQSSAPKKKDIQKKQVDDNTYPFF